MVCSIQRDKYHIVFIVRNIAIRATMTGSDQAYRSAVGCYYRHQSRPLLILEEVESMLFTRLIYVKSVHRIDFFGRRKVTVDAQQSLETVITAQEKYDY